MPYGTAVLKLLVKEDELAEESSDSSYKADGKLHAQERDVAMEQLIGHSF